MALWTRTSTANANWATLSNLAEGPGLPIAQIGEFLVGSATSKQIMMGFGHYSVTFASAMPAAVGFSDLQQTVNSQMRAPMLFFNNFTA